MACQSNRKTTFAVGIGINLAMAAMLIGLALFGKMNDASFIAIMGGVIATNTALLTTSRVRGDARAGCGRCPSAWTTDWTDILSK